MAFRLEQVQKQTQKLIMSPQMQQAIHLLQLPLMELSTLIQQELTANPILEETSPDSDSANENNTDDPSSPEVDFDEEFSRLTELDDEWREYYRQSGSFRRTSDDEEKKRRYYEESISDLETLHEHLLKQWAVSSPGNTLLGEWMIGNIDENGYLTTSLEELAPQNPSHSIQELQQALKIIQTFHPVGVGARDLKECLLLQLTRLGKGESLEARIVQNHLDDLGKRNYPNIAKAMRLPLKDIQKTAELIGTLEPKPGRIFDQERPQYVVPDVGVEKVGDEFIVMLNDERIPHLRISNLYRGLMKGKGLENQTKDYIRQKVQAGKWLIKNIQQRQQTIYNIAQTLVKEQRDFFENGTAFLKPLVMQKVASEVGIHESTVSRAIASKYMATPHGVFQMKYFFTPGLQTQTGENISTTHIKDILNDLIAKEDAIHPMSDQEIVGELKKKGIAVARRTVTKYRKELKILPSNLRKKY